MLVAAREYIRTYCLQYTTRSHQTEIIESIVDYNRAQRYAHRRYVSAEATGYCSGQDECLVAWDWRVAGVDCADDTQAVATNRLHRDDQHDEHVYAYVYHGRNADVDEHCP